MTHRPDVHIFETETDLFAAAAKTFVETMRLVLATRRSFTVALSGGSTPRGLYDRLAAPPLKDDLPWSQVEWYWGDERSVGPDDPESNYRLARESLLDRIAVDASHVHRLRGEADRLSTAAREYQDRLAKQFMIPVDGPPPSLDLVLLGMGSDGHTASLFPFTKALDDRKKWVTANDVPQLDTKRLTLTYPTLNAAGCVLFLVTGAGKAKILREVLEGPPDPRRLPSQAIRPERGKLLWYVDRAAANLLSS
jgi:6-phosphogluconolactonase